MTIIYSYTMPGATFPPSIHISEAEHNNVRVAVRGAAVMRDHENGAYYEHGEVGVIELDRDHAIAFAEAILDRFQSYVDERNNATALSAAQAHIVAGLVDGTDRTPPAEFADAERSVSFPETVANDGGYLYEPHGEGLSGGRYIGLTRDPGDENDASAHHDHIHGHARVG